MPKGVSKFSNFGRVHFTGNLKAIAEDCCSARFSVQYLRPKVRSVLLKVAGGEGVHPEFVRVNLSACVKLACLRAVVYTIPTKTKGLRVQSSDVILGAPGLGKGLGSQWRDDLVVPIKKLLLRYAEDELRNYNNPPPRADNEEADNIQIRKCFKYVDGIERLVDMELPFLLDLPNGSSEAVFGTAARNSGCGMVPILEYVKDRQTILDKTGGNSLFLASHDATVKAMVYKTTESVPEILNNAVFWQIYVNLEDSMDWFKTAGNNGTIRRLCYAYADTSGVSDIPVRNCTVLSKVLKQRLLAMFRIFREHHPQILKFVFSLENAPDVNEGDDLVADNDDVIDDVHDGDLDIMFDGLGNGDGNEILPKLMVLRKFAKEIAQQTHTEADSSTEQLEKNLRSLIGQKAVEFNLLGSLVSRSALQIREYYTNVFTEHHGRIELDECDITEASHTVRRSRRIFQAFLEAEEFEENFLRHKSKMPKAFFIKRNLSLPPLSLAMIFALHYIRGKKTEAKSIKQSLAKNSFFKAFAIKLPEVVAGLTALGVLNTERRMVRKKRDRDGVQVERHVPFFVTLYDADNAAHRLFLEQYQGIYPGEVIA